MIRKLECRVVQICKIAICPEAPEFVSGRPGHKTLLVQSVLSPKAPVFVPGRLRHKTMAASMATKSIVPSGPASNKKVSGATTVMVGGRRTIRAVRPSTR